MSWVFLLQDIYHSSLVEALEMIKFNIHVLLNRKYFKEYCKWTPNPPPPTPTPPSSLLTIHTFLWCRYCYVTTIYITDHTMAKLVSYSCKNLYACIIQNHQESRVAPEQLSADVMTETSGNGLYNPCQIQFGCYFVVICVFKCYPKLMQGSMLTKRLFPVSALLPRVRGFWSWFGGVCSLTYCNGNFRVTMVSEPFNVIL